MPAERQKITMDGIVSAQYHKPRKVFSIQIQDTSRTVVQKLSRLEVENLVSTLIDLLKDSEKS